MVNRQLVAYWFGWGFGLAVCVPLVARYADAQEEVSSASTTVAAGSTVAGAGRLEFDYPGAPPATVEIDVAPELADLGEAMLSSILEGFAEAIEKKSESRGEGPIGPRQVAELEQLVTDIQGVVQEFHLRVYTTLSDAEIARDFYQHYEKKLARSAWENVATVNDKHNRLKIALRRQDQKIRGLFAIVATNREVVLVNVACELSPEKVQSLTTHSMQLAVDLGLDHIVHRAFEEAVKDLVNEIR